MSQPFLLLHQRRSLSGECHHMGNGDSDSDSPSTPEARDFKVTDVFAMKFNSSGFTLIGFDLFANTQNLYR